MKSVSCAVVYRREPSYSMTTGATENSLHSQDLHCRYSLLVALKEHSHVSSVSFLLNGLWTVGEDVMDSGLLAITAGVDLQMPSS